MPKTRKSKKLKKRSRRNFRKNKKGGFFNFTTKASQNVDTVDTVDTVDEKQKFLKLLDEYVVDIDNLVLTDLISDKQSEILKRALITSIALFYLKIDSKKLSELNSEEMRTQAGLILTKTVIIRLLAKCPTCPNLTIDSEKKSEIVSRIVPLLVKPYIGFTDFEKAIKNEKEKSSNS